MTGEGTAMGKKELGREKEKGGEGREAREKEEVGEKRKGGNRK